MTRDSRRPRVICHMMATIDGRIVADRWPAIADFRREYESTAATYGAEAWMCGRITMQPMAGAMRDTSEVSREAAAQAAGGAERADHVARGAHTPCAVAVDPSGRLLWQTSDVDGDHVVTILGHRVSDAYLGALRQRGVSYLFPDERCSTSCQAGRMARAGSCSSRSSGARMTSCGFAIVSTPRVGSP